MCGDVVLGIMSVVRYSVNSENTLQKIFIEKYDYRSFISIKISKKILLIIDLVKLPCNGGLLCFKRRIMMCCFIIDNDRRSLCGKEYHGRFCF